MYKKLEKEDVIINKKEAIKALNKMLESFINDPAEKHLKKANLISYWLKDYVSLINFEEKFEPTKNIAYKRGNIVKLNFGFNIGSEYGGLHYAIVLDKHNDHNSPVVTVIPLTSTKHNKSIHPNSVELGNELYRLLKIKFDTISKSLEEEQNEAKELLKMMDTLFPLAEAEISNANDSPEGSEEYNTHIMEGKSYLDTIEKLKNSWQEKLQHNVNELEYLNKINDEIIQMKEGSVALVNQITTVSKMRIFDPRNIHGVLSGISLSSESMERINKKVKELYIF